MPIVTVAAPPPADAALLGRIADAVAAALGLGAGDVIATLLPAAIVAASGAGAVEAWPVITVHGSDRGADRMRCARAAAEAALAAWAADAGVRLGGIWTEWVLPEPAASTRPAAASGDQAE